MSSEDRRSRRDLLADVCEWYYAGRLTQQDIADRLGVSRSAVSRLLSEAQDEGIIEFRINRESAREEGLEEEFDTAFGVQVRVVKRRTGDDPLVAIGREAASVAASALRPDGVLAISYGTSVFETVRQLPTQHFASMQVVQIAGVEGVANPQVDGWELVRICADRLGARYLHLHSPLMVGSRPMRDVLLDDPAVRKHMDTAAAADLAVVGIGSVEPKSSSLVRAGHLSPEQLLGCVAAGSAGYIGGRHYDAEGRPIEELNDRVVSLPLERLAELRFVIGVAAGPGKVCGIVGALRGGLIDALVTDVPTANAVLQKAKGEYDH